jgi:hypothetical protein
MQAEAIQEIVELVKKGQEITKVNDREYGWFDAEGDFYTAEYLPVPLKDANLKVYSIASLLAVLKDNTLDGSTSSNLTNGQKHVSQELQQQVATANGTSIPEALSINAPVYDLPETLATTPGVTLLVETEVEGEVQFALTTVHNDITRAQETALEDVTAILGDAFPVYRAAF